MSVKHRLAQIAAIAIAGAAVLCTLPLLPIVWLWSVIVQGDNEP